MRLKKGEACGYIVKAEKSYLCDDCGHEILSRTWHTKAKAFRQDAIRLCQICEPIPMEMMV